MASVSSNRNSDLSKQLRSHEVAIAELNNLSSSRAVYQRNANLFFRTSIPTAITTEQKQLDSVKANLKILDSSSS
ncbi:hypothetical protein RJT34_14433 [Clitoria ternatea]|uniref:Uncharacterized protein n=1 Tax=Clitoria ternatea TaxID=43366 RepID=A0AAN9JT48_CLITE